MLNTASSCHFGHHLQKSPSTLGGGTLGRQRSALHGTAPERLFSFVLVSLGGSDSIRILLPGGVPHPRVAPICRLHHLVGGDARALPGKKGTRGAGWERSVKCTVFLGFVYKSLGVEVCAAGTARER
jgi:hypothetical protein